MQTFFPFFPDHAADYLHGRCQRRGHACERLCHLYGHSCVVLIPPCHPRAKSLAPLTQLDLDAATPTVTQVTFRLGRHVSHPITLQYVPRNYYVIKPASLVLALRYFDELRKHVLGGTG